MMKKLVSLVLALMLCLSCVSALAAEAWTVTCPWAPSGVAAMVNQKAASLSTTYSQDYVLVANAEKGDTATIDFEGFDNGVAFDGGKGENFPLNLGSGQFIPGFEEHCRLS